MGIADYERDFAAAPKPTDFDRLPDGDYVGRVDECKEARTQNGTDCVVWEITITEGSQTRRKVWHRRYLKRGDLASVTRLLKDLAMFGLVDVSASEAARRLSECVGAVVEFRLVTSKEYQNVHINAVRPEPAASLPPTVTEHAPVDDDDIPF